MMTTGEERAPDISTPDIATPDGASPDVALRGTTTPAEVPAAVLEALLIVLDGPLAAATVAQALATTELGAETALAELAAAYEGEGRGFRLRRSADGWRLYAAPEHRGLVEAVLRDDTPVRLSQAALETLAVVAYRQPVTRSRVAAVRGVSVDAVMRTLSSRGLVEERGLEAGTGAVLYGTTTLFLDRLGVDSLEELPALGPLLPDVEALQADPDQPLSRG